jgi:alpha,alpha-trehalose phosphorylase
LITHPAFTVEPWSVSEERLNLQVLAQAESVFALSNGHIGLRGNLDEGEPHATPGTYLNGFYEQRPLPYAESAYGDPEDGQTIINVTDGKILRLLVDDEPFDVRYGTTLSHERTLDQRAGVLRRVVVWRSPAGRTVRVTTTRLVSFRQRAVAAIDWCVEALEEGVRVVVQSELVANEPDSTAPTDDPRATAALEAPLVAEEHGHADTRAFLVHRTRASGLRMAAAMDHVIEWPGEPWVRMESGPDLARATIVSDVEPGERLRVVKLLAYGWSKERSLPAVRAQVDGALAQARETGWEELAAGQRGYLDDFWRRADVVVEGDAELQQALRFALFEVLQAGARVEQRAIPAKGLTGAGYDGHAFWDTEAFVLPVLAYVHPTAVDDVLRWRHSTLPAARDRQGARARRRRLPVADDRRPGVLGVLAGGDGGLPRQRRHRGRGDAPRGGDA